MDSQSKPIEVSPQLFLNSLPTELHLEVKSHFHDRDVDHLILMISEQTRQREVVPVGRLSEIKSVADLSTFNREGMQAKAYVDAHKTFPDLSKKFSPKKHTAWELPQKTNLDGSPPVTSPSTRELELQIENENLRRDLAELQSKLIIREKTIEAMQMETEQDSEAQGNATVDERVLIDRENSVQKAEEELINRLTYLMEKEAELEQFEENLQAKENALNKREQVGETDDKTDTN